MKENLTAKTDMKAIYALSLGHFTADLYSSALSPLYPLIASGLGISLAFMSVIISFAHLTSSMLQPFFGFLADKTAHRIFMFWGLILGALFIPLAIFSKNIIFVALFLALAIMGNALFHPQVTAMIPLFTGDTNKLNLNVGIFLGIGITGYALGPVFSTSLIEHFGINSLWFITVSGIIVAFILYFNVPKIPKEFVKKSGESFFVILKKCIKNSAMMSLLLISITKSFVSLTFGTYMPFLLKDYGYSLSQIGVILTIFFLFSGISSVVSGKIEKKIGAENVIRVSFFGILPFTLLLIYALRFNIFLGILIFAILGFLTFLSVSINMIIGQKIMSENKGVASGIIGGFSWAVAAMTLTPLGFLAQYFGVEKVFMGVAVITFLVGLFGISKKLKVVLLEYKNL